MVVVSQLIRVEIEAQTHRILTTSHLLVSARQGRLPPSVVQAYLRSLHYLISHTVPHLHQAKREALARDDHELAVFFEAKEREEAGHEAWAESDMRRLAECFGDAGVVNPAPSIVALARLVGRLIVEHPRLYVVYIVCVEYFTVLIGPAWVDALTRGCGVPATALTVVSKHVEADQVHANEGFAAIERFISGTETEGRAVSAVGAIFQHLAQFPEDLLGLSRQGLPKGGTESQRAHA